MKKQLIVSTLAAVGSVFAIGTANAGSAVIDGLGGPVQLNSKTIDGVFGAGSPEWTGASMSLVHDDLHDSGISTDAVVTFLLMDTDHGLAFAVLVDDNTQGGTRGTRVDSQLGMTSTAPDTGVEFVNDNSEDILNSFDNGNGTQTASGHFDWNADNRGDAFSWASLSEGDFVSFNFTQGGPDHSSFPGLNEEAPFQFVSWNGQSWDVVATGGFSEADQFAFSFTVIPLPAPLAIGLAGLGLAGIARRRMMAKKA